MRKQKNRKTKKANVSKIIDDEKKGYVRRLFKKKVIPNSLEWFAIEAAHHERSKGNGEGPSN